MIFAASLGWSSEEFDDSPELCEKDPYPIPLEIFKNLGLYDAILIMALAKTRNFEVAKSDTETAVIVEGLASAGFRQMGKIYGKCEGYEFLQEWVDVIIKENVESKQ